MLLQGGGRIKPAVLFTIAIASVAITQAHAKTPQLHFEYSRTLDSVCSLFRGGSIRDEWRQELARHQPEFEELRWRVGPELIAATESITGAQFPQDDQTVHLTLCDIPSNSFIGVAANMRYALKSFTPSPVPLRYKADVLFHELLHKFLDQHPPRGSALLEEHADEPGRIRDYLHLLALQKAVLLKLNERAELADVIRIDSQLPGGYYKRAWEIVNAADDEYLKYVAEMPKN